MAPLRDCPFCGFDASILCHERTFAIFDRAPVAPGHDLNIPHRHLRRLARGLNASMPDACSTIRLEPSRRAWPGGWRRGTQTRNPCPTAPATAAASERIPAIR